MRRATALFLLLVTVSYFCSCERDDICPEETPTTPSLVIGFFEFTNQSQAKSVFNLKVIAEGMEQPVLFGTAGTETTNANRIEIPLRTNEDTTTYRFIYNSTSAPGAPLNEDILTFNYTRNEFYISRACGYSTHFYLNDTDDVVLSPGTDPAWILGSNVEKTNIEDESEVHVKLFF